MSKNNERAKEMLTAYLSGKNLEEVGKIYGGITRERVRQIITVFPEYHADKKWHSKHRIPYITKVCPGCKNSFVTQLKTQAHCNSECRKLATRNKWDSMVVKKCSKCGKNKLISDFFGSINGRKMAHCKKCHVFYMISWRKNNPKRAKEIQNKASKKHYEKVRLTQNVVSVK